jgi:hypothetical protein
MGNSLWLPTCPGQEVREPLKELLRMIILQVMKI